MKRKSLRIAAATFAAAAAVTAFSLGGTSCLPVVPADNICITAEAATTPTLPSTISWNIDSSNNLTITGTGVINAAPWKNDSNWNYVKKVTIGNGITAIKYNKAFSGGAFTELELPNSLTEVYDYLFQNCESLRKVTFSGPKSDKGLAFGYYAFDGCTALRTVDLSKTNITIIKDGTFRNCTSLTEVILPEDLTLIGEYAFSGSGLDSISIPDGVTEIGRHSFDGCKYLKTVEMYDCTLIGASSFVGCSQITNVKVYDSVEFPDKGVVIGESAFEGCSTLEEFDVSGNVSSILKNAFYNCAKLKYFPFDRSEGVTEIGIRAFSCTGIAGSKKGANDGSLVLPKSVTTINSYAFSLSNNIKSADLYATTIKNNAFGGCSGIKKVVLHDGIKTIDTETFYNCGALEDVTIPNTVVTLKEGAFEKCASLRTVTLPDSVTDIGNEVFMDCTSLEKIDLTDNVENIGFKTFYNCSSLKKIKIPDAVTVIPGYCFAYCSSLRDVEFHDYITKIDYNAFGACIGLRALKLPKRLLSIGSEAFYNCKNLEAIEFFGDITMNSVGSYAFRYCDKLTHIHIPAGRTAADYAGKHNLPSNTSYYYPGGCGLGTDCPLEVGADIAGDLNDVYGLDAGDIPLLTELLKDPDQKYDPACDVNGDGKFDIRDLSSLCYRVYTKN